MKSLPSLPIQIDKTVLAIGIVIIGILAIVALWEKWFTSKAEAWPITEARIENVFLEVSSRGPNHRDVTHTVLAYGYSIGGSYYSGQIRLRAGERSVDLVGKEMVGQHVSIHYVHMTAPCFTA